MGFALLVLALLVAVAVLWFSPKARRWLDRALHLALLSAWMANPASAANTIEWFKVPGTDPAMAKSGDRGPCWKASITTTNETDDTEFLFVGGAFMTLQVEGDAAGAGASEGDLLGCTAPAAAACAALNLADANLDGTLDDNTFDGTAGKRGTLDPVAIPGWVVVQPAEGTIDSGEVQEWTFCAVR